jgi:translation initiation factor 1
MPQTCPKCGLPLELCACKAIEREAQKINISIEKRKFGKITTIIEGITDNAKEVASQLKARLACGGTFKNGRIELQGDHRKRVKDILVKMGYKEDHIELV